MSDELIQAEVQFQIKALKDANEKLMKENSKLKLIVKELDPDFNPSTISDAYALADTQLRMLKEISDERELSADEVKKFDILHKNWKLAKGEDIKVNWERKVEKISDEDLEKIAKKNIAQH